METALLTSEPVIQSSVDFARNRTVRRRLQRWWVKDPIRWAAWLMLNPSDATADKDDPTTRRLTSFTRSWGYDGWIAMNLYPFVSSTPDAMWKRADWQNNGPDWYARDDMQANIMDIETVARFADLRMVAFGAQPIERDQAWLEQCLEAFGQPGESEEDGGQFYCLGVNKTGQPLHPMARGRMRVPNDTVPILWEPSRNADQQSKCKQIEPATTPAESPEGANER